MTGRLEVARHLVELLGHVHSIKIRPVASDNFAKEYFATRPASERLIAQKLSMRGLNVMRDWHVCLKVYLKENYQDICDHLS